MPETTPMITKSMLINARNMIDKYGLAHRRFLFEDGSCCTMGAIAESLSLPAQRSFAWRTAYIGEEVANLFGFEYSYQVFQWNDQSTKEQVLAKFDEIIAQMPDEEVRV